MFKAGASSTPEAGVFSDPGVPCLALGVDTVFFRFPHHRRLADAQATGGLVGAARFVGRLPASMLFQSTSTARVRIPSGTLHAARWPIPHVGRQVGRSDDFRLGQCDQGLDHSCNSRTLPGQL